jgi:hypothetical protein
VPTQRMPKTGGGGAIGHPAARFRWRDGFSRFRKSRDRFRDAIPCEIHVGWTHLVHHHRTGAPTPRPLLKLICVVSRPAPAPMCLADQHTVRDADRIQLQDSPPNMVSHSSASFFHLFHSYVPCHCSFVPSRQCCQPPKDQIRRSHGISPQLIAREDLLMSCEVICRPMFANPSRDVLNRKEN